MSKCALESWGMYWGFPWMALSVLVSFLLSPHWAACLLCQLPAIKDILEIPNSGHLAFPSFVSELHAANDFHKCDSLWVLILLKLKCLPVVLHWVLTDFLQGPTTGLWRVPQSVQMFNDSHLLPAALKWQITATQRIRCQNRHRKIPGKFKRPKPSWLVFS